MKYFVILIVLLFFTGCRDHSEELKRNFDMKIASINYGNQMSGGKHNHLIGCNEILFETVDSPKKYVSLNDCTCSWRTKIRQDDWKYNHRVGDVVHFDYLRKDRFFEIREDLQP